MQEMTKHFKQSTSMLKKNNCILLLSKNDKDTEHANSLLL